MSALRTFSFVGIREDLGLDVFYLLAAAKSRSISYPTFGGWHPQVRLPIWQTASLPRTIEQYAKTFNLRVHTPVFVYNSGRFRLD